MIRVQWGGIIPAWLAVTLAVIGGVGIWVWYFRETRWVRAPWSYVLPTLRSASFVLIVLMLAGPTLLREWISGQLSRIAILVDESVSMELRDEASDSTRIERIDQWLAGTDPKPGWLSQQSARFHLQLMGIEVDGMSQESLRPVWDSSSQSADQPIQFSLQGTGQQSPLGDALATMARSSTGPSQVKPTSDGATELSAIMLLTDGQSNAGESATAVAERLRDLAIPVFTVGFGRIGEPDDLGVLGVDHARSIFPSDALQGTVTIKQQLPIGQSFRVAIRHDDRLVWSQDLQSDGASTRQVDFRFPAEKLFSRADETPLNRNKAVPIDLEFQISHEGQDAAVANNKLPSSLWGVTQKNRVLVMDRRGRWETRYIKNAFQRDATWELDAILGPNEFEQRGFPKNRDELLAIDLLILGLDSLPALSDVQLKWITDHVAESGSGLVWIDSGREPPPPQTLQQGVEWLPVALESDPTAVAIESLQLLDTAWNERAFSFEEDAMTNRRLWESLPAPRVARRVTAAPGAEVLVAGKSQSGNEHPMVVTRRLGQGRIVYLANDESWRWRYNVADQYHQRFWNQLAQWTMQTPFALENDFVALDTGDRTCKIGQSIPLRTQLRNPDRSPMTGARAAAVISRNAMRIDSIPLRENGEGTGLYSADAGPYPSGLYEIRLEVAGVPDETLKLTSEVRVQPETDLEMQALSQNPALLQQIALASGGLYFDESETSRVSESLSKYQTGKIEQQQILLWQSYPWFLTVMVLLSLEWFLRKKAGLV